MTLLQLLTSGPADGTAASTSNTGASLVNTGTGGSSVWKNSVGAHSNTGVLQTTTTSGQSNAMRFGMSASNSKVQATAKITTPSSAPGAEYQLMSFRYASGRMFSIVWETTGVVRVLDSANTITQLTAAGVLSLGTQYVFAAVADRVAGSFTVHVYAVGSSTALGTASVGSGAALTANDFSAVDSGGGTAVGNHGIVDLQINDGSGSEIADYVASTPLATPVVTLGTKTDPTTVGGTNGTQAMSWPAVTNATSYDVELATNTSPAQSDFVLVAANVTSPYTVTGLSNGSYAYGVKAKP